MMASSSTTPHVPHTVPQEGQQTFTWADDCWQFTYYQPANELTPIEKRWDRHTIWSKGSRDQAVCLGDLLFEGRGYWHCTLGAGHPGPHVGGIGDSRCRMRWENLTNISDLDQGSDAGV